MMTVERHLDGEVASEGDPGASMKVSRGGAGRQRDTIPWEERDAAGQLGLTREPKTDAAGELVDRVLVEVQAVLAKPLRPTSAKKARKAISGLLAGLMQHQAKGRCGSHGLSRADFTGYPFGHDVFVLVMDAMRASKLLLVNTGWGRITQFPGGPVIRQGVQVTRFQLTPKLIELSASLGVPIADWRDHWSSGKPIKVTTKPDEPRVVLKSANVRKGPRVTEGRPMRFDAGDLQARRILAELNAINAYLGDQDIGGIGFPGLRRIFSNGDLPGFTWRWGGRFYSLPGGDRYEAMDQEERFERIAINGEAIGEVDLRASHITLLHALLQKPFDASIDPYEHCTIDRFLVKAWVTKALGLSSVKGRGWSKTAVTEYAEAYPGRRLSADIKCSTVRDAVLQRHPTLKDLATSGIGTLDLQFHEAEILLRAMAILREMEDVPALPLHDALLVPLSRMDVAERALKEAWSDYLIGYLGHRSTVIPRVTKVTSGS